MRRRNHSKEEYTKAMKLLRKYKSPAKVGKLLRIPRTTVRNWKLRYVTLDKKKVIEEKDIVNKMKNIIDSVKSIPELATKSNIPYNSCLLIVRKYFPNEYKQLKKKPHKLSEEQKKMSPELAYILGVMFGDGCAKEYCRISLYVIDKEFRDTFAERVSKWCGLKPGLSQRVSRGRLFYLCYFDSKDMQIFFNEIKEGKIPKDLVYGNDNVKRMFIKGFADSEGSFQRYTIGIYNTNTNVLDSIRNMLISLGFDENRLRIRVSHGSVYELVISGSDSLKLYKEIIGSDIKRKQEKLEATTGI